MELVIHQELEFIPEPIERIDFTNKGLLNSNYKSVVKQNFSKSNTKSIFGIRQRIKFAQFNMINHTAVILKLAVFAIALLAIF